jgi:hypothetical protein
MSPRGVSVSIHVTLCTNNTQLQMLLVDYHLELCMKVSPEDRTSMPVLINACPCALLPVNRNCRQLFCYRLVSLPCGQTWKHICMLQQCNPHTHIHRSFYFKFHVTQTLYFLDNHSFCIELYSKGGNQFKLCSKC